MNINIIKYVNINKNMYIDISTNIDNNKSFNINIDMNIKKKMINYYQMLLLISAIAELIHALIQ